MPKAPKIHGFQMDLAEKYRDQKPYFTKIIQQFSRLLTGQVRKARTNTPAMDPLIIKVACIYLNARFSKKPLAFMSAKGIAKKARVSESSANRLFRALQQFNALPVLQDAKGGRKKAAGRVIAWDGFKEFLASIGVKLTERLVEMLEHFKRIFPTSEIVQKDQDNKAESGAEAEVESLSCDRPYRRYAPVQLIFANFESAKDREVAKSDPEVECSNPDCTISSEAASRDEAQPCPENEIQTLEGPKATEASNTKPDAGEPAQGGNQSQEGQRADAKARNTTDVLKLVASYDNNTPVEETRDASKANTPLNARRRVVAVTRNAADRCKTVQQNTEFLMIKDVARQPREVGLLLAMPNHQLIKSVGFDPIARRMGSDVSIG